MLIDLHTHSSRSDGTDAPAELVAKAAAAGVDVLGLTDHDTAAGWTEAQQAAADHDVVLLPGMEVSCRYRGAGVHLLCYLADPAAEPLADELAAVLDGRRSRLPAILQRLRGLGIDIDVSDVRAVSGDTTATGRPHVADALVALGVVRDRDEAFDRFLSPGRPAYVDRRAADLLPMIGLVAAAGGVTVLAHPWSRGSRRVLDGEAFAELAAAGLAGLEADHFDHAPADRDALRGIAGELDLVVTGSSDHHGTGKTGHPLGGLSTAPDQLARLLDRAAVTAATARAAGAQPPPLPVVPGRAG